MDDNEKLYNTSPAVSSGELTDLINKAIEKKKQDADEADVQGAASAEDITAQTGEEAEQSLANEVGTVSDETAEQTSSETFDRASMVELDLSSIGHITEEDITPVSGGASGKTETELDTPKRGGSVPANKKHLKKPDHNKARTIQKRSAAEAGKAGKAALKDRQSSAKAAAPESKKAANGTSGEKSGNAAAAVINPQNVKKKKSSKKKKVALTLEIIALTCMIALAVGAGLFFYYAHLLNRDGDDKINNSAAPVDERDIIDEPDTFDGDEQDRKLREELQKSAKRISSEDVMNILLIGEDIRDTETQERANTDVMMIISINRENRTITMTSLMRDMYVYMEKFNVSGKLNSAYWHDGSDYLAEVIEDYFRIDIDRYVKVNFRQFIDIVETLGGLDVDVTYNEAYAMMKPLDEQNKYLHYEKGTDYVDLEQYGEYPWEYRYGDENEPTAHLHLNGNQALAYTRIRYGCGDDYARTQRQREVISLMIDKSKKLSLTKLDKLIKAVFPEVETDIDDGEIALLLLNTNEYLKYDIQQLRIPVDGYYTDDTIWSQAVLRPDYQANAAIMRNMIYGSQETAERAAAQYESELANGTFYEKNGIEPPYNYY